MKNKQKGFVSILIIFGVVALIGFGAYALYLPQDKTIEDNTQDIVDSENNTSIANDVDTFDRTVDRYVEKDIPQEDTLLDTKNTLENNIKATSSPVVTENSMKVFKGVKNLGFKAPNKIADFISVSNEENSEITYFLDMYSKELGESFMIIGEVVNNESSPCFIEQNGDDEGEKKLIYNKNYLITGKKFTEVKYKNAEVDNIVIFNTESQNKCLFIYFSLQYVSVPYYNAIFEETNGREMTKSELDEYTKKNNLMVKNLDAIRTEMIQTVGFY